MSDWDVLSIIHGKLLGCSNDAVATFWRVVTWARGPGAKALPGFVNKAQIRALSGGISAKRFGDVLRELEDAGKPQHENGLLDPADGGWWIHGFDEYGKEVDIVAQLEPVPVVQPTPSKAVSEARAAAGRAGGLRSVAVRLATKQTAQPPKQSVDAKNTLASTLPKQATGSSFGSGSGSDLEIREIPTVNPHPKDLIGQRAGEVCFDDEEFSKLSVGERADLIALDKANATALKPHLWDEVRAIVKAFVLATGIERGLAAYDRDRGVQSVVALLCVFETEAIIRAIPVATKTEFWLARPGRDLGQLSVTVIEDALGRDAAAARAKAARRRALEGSLVPRKTTPPPLSREETLRCAAAALEATTHG